MFSFSHAMAIGWSITTIQPLVPWPLILVYSRCMYVKDRRSSATDQKNKEANMVKLGQVINKKIGIWIDHKEAILVSIEGDQTIVERIESNAELLTLLTWGKRFHR
jgi:hypothetical protein